MYLMSGSYLWKIENKEDKYSNLIVLYKYLQVIETVMGCLPSLLIGTTVNLTNMAAVSAAGGDIIEDSSELIFRWSNIAISLWALIINLRNC